MVLGPDDRRVQYWMDTLKEDERVTAQYILGMPGGSMAVAWVAVEVVRNRIFIEGKLNEILSTSSTRTPLSMTALGFGGGSGVIAAAVAVAKFMRWI